MFPMWPLIDSMGFWVCPLSLSQRFPGRCLALGELPFFFLLPSILLNFNFDWRSIFWNYETNNNWGWTNQLAITNKTNSACLKLFSCVLDEKGKSYWYFNELCNRDCQFMPKICFSFSIFCHGSLLH